MSKKNPKKSSAAMPHTVNIKRMARDVSQKWTQLSDEELADIDKRLDEAYPGGFNDRDEANALIAMAVRNGPIEDLHAGRSSTLLEDDTLSRITDEEIKIL